MSYLTSLNGSGGEAPRLASRPDQDASRPMPSIGPTMPRAPGSRQKPGLADCVPHRRRRHSDLGSLWENDSTDATERYRHVQEEAEALRQPGLVDGRICSMNSAKKARLEAAGWKVGTAAEFLELNKQEAAFVEMKLALARCLHALRIRRKLSQSRVAELVGSSQSRVAKMESGDPSVSIDLLLRSVLAIGGSPTEVVRALASRKKLPPA